VEQVQDKNLKTCEPMEEETHKYLDKYLTNCRAVFEKFPDNNCSQRVIN